MLPGAFAVRTSRMGLNCILPMRMERLIGAMPLTWYGQG